MDMPASPAPAASLPPKPPVRPPQVGELMPAFAALSDRNPRFLSASLGGQWMVLMFFGSLGLPLGRAAHDTVLTRRGMFDDRAAQFFGVGIDPADRIERSLKNSMPGLRYFWDFDQVISRRYGPADDRGFTPTAFLVDPGLRICAIEPLERIDALLDRLGAILEAEKTAPYDLPAPVLTLPRVLAPELCRAMIDYYDRVGGAASGFMREVDGVTYPVQDDAKKRRRDVEIEDEALRAGLLDAVSYSLIPQIARAFWWTGTRIERYIVACYTAEDQGFFSPHRDNVSGGTAHRRFAVTINLNDDFDGGELRFPEFGRRTYRPPLGGATVFSCSLMHEATPVTRGVRYATLPFLYDEAGSKIREANRHLIADKPLDRSGPKP